jgi:RimJ/RimL family protein N-acetyltransferase
VHRAFRDDVEVAGVEFDFFTFELNQQASEYDEKEIVLVLVVVPRQLTFDLRNLHVLIVDATNHFRRPVVGKLVKALLKIDFHRKIITEMPFDLQPTLTGELLELRPLRAHDFEPLYAVASDPLIWEQHPSADRYQRDVFQKFFDEAVESGGALLALDRQDNQVIGSSRFHCYDLERSEVEIGWTFLARSHWGGVYNGEMKRLMLAHAFRFVDNVIFVIGATNLRSQRAVEKIGGVRVGSKTDPHGRESLIFRISRAL